MFIGDTLTYKGIQQPEWLIITGGPLEIAPPIQYSLKDVPNRHGAYLQSKKFGARPFKYECYIKAETKEQLQAYADWLVSWLDGEEAGELFYSGKPGRAINALWTNEAEFKRLITDGEGALTFIAYDPFYYGPEYTTEITKEQFELDLGGTAETFPLFKIALQQKTTFISVITPNDVVMLGRPYNQQTEQPIERETVVLNDSLSNTVGWTAGSAVDGIAQGAIQSDGSGFFAADYGASKNTWYGPAIKKSLPEPLDNYKVEALFSTITSPTNVSRAEVYGLDANGLILFKIGVYDATGWTARNEGIARVGDAAQGRAIQQGPAADLVSWNQFDGGAMFYKDGDYYATYIYLIDHATGKRHTERWIEWRDIERKYSGKKLAQIQLHLGRYTANYAWTVAEQRFDNIKVSKINSPGENQVPYIGGPGDVIEIDHRKKAVYINGKEDNSIYDPRGNMFSLQPGKNFLSVYPAGVGAAEITYRERFK